MGDDCPVRVAIRVRPLVPRETNEGCQTCLTFARDQHQLTVGTNRAFSYDFVLPPEASQEELYSQAVKPLIEKIYSGYNSTVLAYGQTGSGKTFTMGTGDALTMDDGTGEVTELTGVVPRVVRDLFDGFKDREHLWQCDVTCSFFELYNEEINDLFAKLKGKTQVVNIREINNEILLSGLTEEGATSPSEVLWLLTHASEGRSVGSTAMNQQSSRSHAIFTINVTMSRKDDPDGRDKMTAKFQLVDLAGSERAKKTKAEGERFKEGVNINRGLLALGNVIAALGDEKTRGGHVSYRDSKLTRILQDSLGGNSNTVMIACVSPADTNMDETVNTLRYADRAKNIKNKPVINMDPLALEIQKLRKENQRLRAQLLSMGIAPEEGDLDLGELPASTIEVKSSDSVAYIKLREEKECLAKDHQDLQKEYAKSMKLVSHLQEKYFQAESARESLLAKVEELETTTAKINASLLIVGGAADNSTNETRAGNTSTETSFVANKLTSAAVAAQEQIKMLQEQFSQLKETVHGEPYAEEPKLEPEDQENDGGVSDDLDEKEHMMRQARYGEELTNMDKILVQKEIQLKKMRSGETEMNSLRQNYEESVESLEKEVSKLQKEKNELQKSVKISEERRKKVQELEARLAELRKHTLELNRLKKMKDENDKTVKRLTEDIVGLKSMRVKHIRQMKADAEEFRKWKQAKDKEVKQLKEAERKRHYALVKLERKHELQAAVLKRKTEEASAAKKRLDDVLKKRSEIRNQRGSDLQPAGHQSANQEYMTKKVENFLTTEIDSKVAKSDGKRNLDQLIEDRKAMTKQLRRLETDLKNGGDTNEPVLAKIAKVKGDIELRNCQVQELQQQMLDLEASKEDFKFATNTEYKVGLKLLMNKAVMSRMEEMNVRNAKSRLEDALQETHFQVDELQKLLHEKEADYEERLSDLIHQNEERVLFLLREVNRTGRLTGLPEASAADLTPCDADTLKRLQFQQGEIQRLTSLVDELDKQRKLNRELMIKLKEAGETKEAVQAIKRPSKTKTVVENEIEEEEDEDSEMECEDYEDDDPNWTPGLKKVRSASFLSVADPKSRLFSDEIPEKKRRTFMPAEVMKCNCKKWACNTKQCACQKSDRGCGASCGCNKVKCQNQRAAPFDGIIDESNEESNGDQSDHTLESTFVKQPVIQRKKGRRQASAPVTSDKENKLSATSTHPTDAPPRENMRQRSRPLTPTSLDGTFNVESIEEDEKDVKMLDSDSEEESLDTVESTPDAFKLPALRAKKAKKYADKVSKEGGYFSPKYVPVNPGLKSDDVL